MHYRHFSFALLFIPAVLGPVYAALASLSSPQHITINNMEPLQDPLGDQRARLHNIADLMLAIYETLADMSYLNRSGIEVGPHDLSKLQPILDEYNLDLDPAIVYLYSILPYINCEVAGQSDFYKNGQFVDFRHLPFLEWGRNPLYAEIEDNAGEEDQNGPYMKPWYTPLSFLGNHYTMLVYDAREHRIWVLEHDWTGSSDPLLKDIPVKNPTKNENSFEYIPNRPAEDVLRDINKWYRELEEIPGGDDAEGTWSREIDLASLYRKNGWPDRFDAEGFRAEQCRKYEALMAKHSADQPLNEVNKFIKWSQSDQHQREQRQRILESAVTADDIWMAKFNIIDAEIGLVINAEDRKRAEIRAARLCPGGVCQREEDLPLWEVEFLRRAIEGMEGRVTFGETMRTQQGNNLRPRAEQMLKKLVRQAEERIPVYRKALEAAKADVDTFCSGRTPQSVLGMAELFFKPDVEKSIEGTGASISNLNIYLNGLTDWARNIQLPDEAIKTKAALEDKIQKTERELKEAKDRLHAAETEWARENPPGDL